MRLTCFFFAFCTLAFTHHAVADDDAISVDPAQALASLSTPGAPGAPGALGAPGELDAIAPSVILTSAAMAAPPASDPFAQGQWTFSAYASGTIGMKDKGEIHLGHAGVGYFLVDCFSVNIEGIIGYTDAEEPGAQGDLTYGFDLLFRWHFVVLGDLSVYIEGGAGMVWFSDAFPLGGTRQNFTPQGGIGFTYRCAPQCLLMAGVRWHHVSNAGKHDPDDRNPGYDGIMIYAGVTMPF